MASRRLAISSLLCDGDGDVPRSRDGDNLVASSPLPAAVRPPPSSRHPDFDIPDDHFNNATTQTPYPPTPDVQVNPRLRSLDFRRQSGHDAFRAVPPTLESPGFAPSRSITPLPLALQPAIIRHRTPSPPPMHLPTSVARHAQEDYYVDDRDGRPSSPDYYDQSYQDYPPDVRSTTMYAAHSSTRFTQHSSPPSSSSENATDLPTGRPSLPVSSFRFSPPEPRLPLPVGTPHDYHPQRHPTTFHAGPSSYQADVASFVPSVAGRAVDLSVKTRDGHHVRAGISPVQPRPPAPSVLSGLDVLVQAATEERERIDEHRRLSGGSERHYLSADDRSYTGHVQSPVSASSLRTHRLSPETRARPLQAQGHVFSSNVPGSSEQPRTIYNYNAQESQASVRRRSTPTVSPGAESDAKLMLADAILRSHQANSHVSNRSANSPVNSLQISLENEASTPDTHFSSSMQELSLSSSSRALPNQSVPSPPPMPQPSSSSEQSRHPPSSALSPITASTHRGRTPPRSKPRPKPGSMAQKQPSHRLVVDARDSEDAGGHSKLPVRKSQTVKHDMRKQRPEDEAALVKSSRRASAYHPPLREESEEHDERDAHDFFLSVFDSPRQAMKNQAQRESSASHSHKREREQHASHYLQPNSHPLKSSTRVLPESDVDDDFASAARVTPVGESEEVDDDVDDDLADVVAHSVHDTGDEAAEVETEFAERMDVDVEDELLSLVEPSQPEIPLAPHASSSRTRFPGSLAKEFANADHAEDGRLSPESRDRLSMPPPMTGSGKAGKRAGKETKTNAAQKDTKVKPAGSRKEAKSSRKASIKTEDSSAKGSKPKAAGVARPKASLEKLKGAKQVTDCSVPDSATMAAPTGSAAPSTAATTDDPFPTVTSSGRMVKKSIASTLAAQAAATSSKKKALATPSAGAEGGNSRSRSHSAIPRASVDPELENKTSKVNEEKNKEEDEATEEDDKLYCICRTKYDEDRVMIACDRCDEWYHTQCVKMPDLQVDLVDQFICPICVKGNPGLQLKTTYKTRCFTGLKHPKPNSEDACHKPARGAFSKYCSDECGVNYMHMKAQVWAHKGGDVHRLWENVKDAKPREGVVIRETAHDLPKAITNELSKIVSTNEQAPDLDMDADIPVSLDNTSTNEDPPTGSASGHKIRTLEAQLRKVVAEREDRKKEMEAVEWRHRFLQLAISRAEHVGECGWDQRLCIGDEEWKEFGDAVLESYECSADDAEIEAGAQESEWWCSGERKCQRHAGWQKLRERELNNEREELNDVLVQLTTREREIRNRIEDILHPKAYSDLIFSPKLPLTTNSSNTLNGKEDGTKKRKKMAR